MLEVSLGVREQKDGTVLSRFTKRDLGGIRPYCVVKYRLSSEKISCPAALIMPNRAEQSLGEKHEVRPKIASH